MSSRPRFTLILVFSAVLLVLLGCLDLVLGGSYLSAKEVIHSIFSGDDALAGNIIWKLRLPRMLTAAAAGASLALSGTLMQGVFRNPLADPHIMGVSSGASLGAALCGSFVAAGSLSVFSGLGIMASAFIGAVAVSALVMAVSSAVRNVSTLLLFGVLLGFVLSSATTLLEYFAPEHSLKVFYSWSSGSFSASGMSQVIAVLAALVVSFVISMYSAKGLDIHLFGDDYVTLCGANPSRIRLWSLLGCCISTAAVTAVCGPLGFVGIVSSHVARKLLSTSVHIKVIPVSMLVGAGFAVLSDMISQMFSSPLPAGSVMALCASPLVLLILLNQKS